MKAPERMKVSNDRTTQWTKFEFGSEAEFRGQASLSERLIIEADEASKIGGRNCGVARFVKSEGQKIINWVIYYDEAIYIIRGKGRFTRSDPPHKSLETYDVGPGDYFYIPLVGTRVCIEPLSDEPFEWFYCCGFGRRSHG